MILNNVGNECTRCRLMAVGLSENNQELLIKNYICDLSHLKHIRNEEIMLVLFGILSISFNFESKNFNFCLFTLKSD